MAQMSSVEDRSREAYALLRPTKTVLPLIAVGGSRGKSTVSWMLDAMIRDSGGSVGSWLTSGVYVDGERMEGELRPWSRVLLAAKYRELDVVIQEMEATMVVGAGLPARTYPCAVLTTICGNDDSCRLSMSTELEERSLMSVVGAVRDDGCIVGNADDLSIVTAMRTTAARGVLFALHPENPVLQRHLSEGFSAVWLDGGSIVYGDYRANESLVPVADIPATLDGTLIFQIQNAMAAASMALELGINPAVISHSLRNFEPQHATQPGACNIVEAKGAQIVVDAPTQTWSLKMLARGIKHQPHRRTVVVSGCFPALSAEDAREVGRILGALGGVVILHNDDSANGRMDSIKAGIAANPVPPLMLVLGTEVAAVDQMLLSIGAGDTALILADHPTEVLQQIASFSTS
ncbi:hypothetical protein BH20CHL1_BH20CHL1_02490 [soil metagenome]